MLRRGTQESGAIDERVCRGNCRDSGRQRPQDLQSLGAAKNTAFAAKPKDLANSFNAGGELNIRTRTAFISCVFLAAALVPGACNRRGPADDKAITEDIQSKLYQDSTLKTRDISVISQNGVVVLVGQVNSDDEKAAAEHLAAAVDGVKQVISQLAVVGTPGALPQRAKAPTASGPAANAEQGTPRPPTPPKPVVLTLPAGTVVTVQMIDSINCMSRQPGNEFNARLAAPLAVGEQVLFMQGSNARVRLVYAEQAGRIKGSSELQIRLVSLTRKDKIYPLQADFLQAKRGSRTNQTGKQMAGGAALTQAVTNGNEVEVPSGTKLEFKLSVRLEIEL